MQQAVIALGAAVALLLAAVGFQQWRLGQAHEALGQAQTETAVCRDANTENFATITALEDELNACIGETNVIDADLAADRERLAAQNERLARQLETLQGRLAATLAGDRCAGEPVPAAAGDWLREAADRAHRAGRDSGAPVGSGSG